MLQYNGQSWQFCCEGDPRQGLHLPDPPCFSRYDLSVQNTRHVQGSFRVAKSDLNSTDISAASAAFCISGFLLCSLNSLDISTLTLCKVTASAFVELYRPLYYSNQVWWGGAPLEAPVFHQERFCQRGNSLHRWKKNTKCWRSHFVVLCTRGADGSVKKNNELEEEKETYLLLSFFMTFISAATAQHPEWLGSASRF